MKGANFVKSKDIFPSSRGSRSRSNNTNTSNNGSNQLDQSSRSSNVSSNNSVSRTGNGVRDWIAGKTSSVKEAAGSIFGRGLKPDSSDNSVSSSYPKKDSRGPKFIQGDPEFLGGQVYGAAYRFQVRYEEWWGDTLQYEKLSPVRTGQGKITGFNLYQKTWRDFRLEVVFETSVGTTGVAWSVGTSYANIEYRNPRFELLERVDGTTQEDDRAEGGDPPNLIFQPTVRTATINLPSSSGFTPPPTIYIPDVTITLFGPGGFFVDPPPPGTGVIQPSPVTIPTPGNGTSPTPTPNPSSTPQPVGKPQPQPQPQPIAVPVSPSSTGTGTNTETSPGTSAGISSGTSPGTGVASPLSPTFSPSPFPNVLPTPSPSPNPNPLTSSPPVSPSVGESLDPIIKPTIKEGAQGKVLPVPFSPSPPVPPGAGGTGGCSSCSKEIGAKVDNLGNALGLVNAGGQAIDLALLNVINTKLGPQVNGGISGRLQQFSESIRFDRALNVLNNLLLIHNAAQLSRNLGESLSYFINTGLQAIQLVDEDENPIDINGFVGGFVSGTIKTIVGEELYNGLSTGWKKTSAIYTAAMNIYELTTNSMAGIAEGLEIAGQYTGKIGNALKKGGVIVENAYEWMDENIRVKTGRLGKVQKVIDGLQSAEEVVSNLTEVTEQVKETQENINEISEQFNTIKTTVNDNETAKKNQEDTGKTNSESPDIQTSDLNKPS